MSNVSYTRLYLDTVANVSYTRLYFGAVSNVSYTRLYFDTVSNVSYNRLLKTHTLYFLMVSFNAPIKCVYNVCI